MLLVLRGTRRSNEGGIDQRSLTHQQAALFEHRVDLGEHRLRQVIGFQQMAKPHQGGRVGHALLAKINSHEAGWHDQ